MNDFKVYFDELHAIDGSKIRSWVVVGAVSAISARMRVEEELYADGRIIEVTRVVLV